MPEGRPATIGRVAVLGALVVAATALPGCHFWNRLWGKDTIELEKADIKSMSVDIRKDQKTICPREPVQMAVFAEAVLEGEKEAKSLETWAGRGSVNKNDKLDFVEFAFHSELGAFDGEGWFAPNASLLATAGKEFEIQTVYKKRPDQFSFTTKYKPDYVCIKGGGKHGQAGPGGSHGSSGSPGHDGQLGSTSQAGGRGTPGASGAPGGDAARDSLCRFPHSILALVVVAGCPIPGSRQGERSPGRCAARQNIPPRRLRQPSWSSSRDGSRHPRALRTRRTPAPRPPLGAPPDPVRPSPATRFRPS